MSACRALTVVGAPRPLLAASAILGCLGQGGLLPPSQCSALPCGNGNSVAVDLRSTDRLNSLYCSSALLVIIPS